MRTAQVSNDKIIVQETKDITLDGKKGAIVKVLGCGLCGSDIFKFKHKLVSDGAVLGHEIVAVIDQIDSDTDFKIGEKIVTSHHIPCFDCTYCKHGNYSMCAHFKSTNIFPGGFSEKVFVSEEHLKNVAYRVPANITNIKALGSNRLLYDGDVPALCADDICDTLSFDSHKTEQKQRVIQLDIFEQKIYNILQSGEESFDSLVIKAELVPPKLSAVLSGMEIKGLIVKKQSNIFGLA